MTWTILLCQQDYFHYLLQKKMHYLLLCIIYYYPMHYLLLSLYTVPSWAGFWMTISAKAFWTLLFNAKPWNWEGPKILWIFIFNNYEMHVEVNPAHITGLVRMYESVFLTWIIYFTTNKSKYNRWTFRKLIPFIQLHKI